MAGMLAGVGTARRRRVHRSGSMNSRSESWRRSSGLEPHLSLNSLQRSGSSGGFHAADLGNAVRKAKERLDEKFRSQRDTEIKRHNSMGGGGDHGEGLGSMITVNLQREVYSKKDCRKFSWTMLEWKALEQKDCAVCLDEFKTGDILAHLPCSHRFHWGCAVPWLESASHCPCCRMAVIS